MQKFWHTEPEEGTEILPNKLDDAWTKLTLVQDNAKAHKKEFLNKKCEEARSQGDKPKAEKLRAIISSEYLARLWPKLLCRYAKGEIRKV